MPESILINFIADQACNFIKIETLAQVFSCEFCEISKNTFSNITPPVAASAPVKELTEKKNYFKVFLR